MYIRISDAYKFHGSGRRLEEFNDGITLQITKSSEGACAIYAYLYLFMDAKLNIIDGRYSEIIYKKLKKTVAYQCKK